MGIKDVASYTLRKVKPSGTAGVISCASLIIGVLFAVIAFSVAVFSRNDFAAQDHLLTSLVVNGMKQSPPAVSYPQLTFCPFWKEGVISNIVCKESNRSDHDMMTRTLLPKIMNSTWTSAKYPNNVCHAYNFDGKQFASWDQTVMCAINSTNTDGTTSWPGRVRVFIDTPGTTNFDGCDQCVDGIDGTLAVAGYFTAGFWQANVVDVTFDDDDDGVVDYKTSSQRFPMEARAGRPVFDDIIFLGGFFSPHVWKFQKPSDFQAAISGEQFGHFTALVGGLGLVAWFIWSCLSTTLILLVVGAEGLPDRSDRTPL